MNRCIFTHLYSTIKPLLQCALSKHMHNRNFLQFIEEQIDEYNCLKLSYHEICYYTT